MILLLLLVSWSVPQLLVLLLVGWSPSVISWLAVGAKIVQLLLLVGLCPSVIGRFVFLGLCMP